MLSLFLDVFDAVLREASKTKNNPTKLEQLDVTFNRLCDGLPNRYATLEAIYNQDSEILKSSSIITAPFPPLSEIYFQLFVRCFFYNRLDFFKKLKERFPNEYDTYKYNFLLLALKYDRFNFLIDLIDDFLQIKVPSVVFDDNGALSVDENSSSDKKAHYLCETYTASIKKLCIGLANQRNIPDLFQQDFSMLQSAIFATLSIQAAKLGDIELLKALVTIGVDICEAKKYRPSEISSTPIAAAWDANQKETVAFLIKQMIRNTSTGDVINFTLQLCDRMLSSKMVSQRSSANIRDCDLLSTTFAALTPDDNQKDDANVPDTIKQLVDNNRIKSLIRTALLNTRIESLVFLCEFYIENKIKLESKAVELTLTTMMSQTEKTTKLDSVKKQIRLEFAQFLLEIVTSDNFPLETKIAFDKFFKYCEPVPNAAEIYERIRVDVQLFGIDMSASQNKPATTSTSTTTGQTRDTNRRNSIANLVPVGAFAASLSNALSPLSAPANLAANMVGKMADATAAATGAVVGVTRTAAETVADVTATAAEKVVNVTDAVTKADAPARGTIQAAQYGKR